MLRLRMYTVAAYAEDFMRGRYASNAVLQQYRILWQVSFMKTSSSHLPERRASCRALSDQELEKILESLSLICLEMEKQKRQEAWKARRKLMGIIRSHATRMFEANAQIRVDGFCEKCIGKALERCNEKELKGYRLAQKA